MTAARRQLSGEELLAPAARGPVEALQAPPSFAIVITAFEAADTVAAAVRSAVEQEHPARQVVVVDDGSNDELAAALRPFGDQIELVRKRNGGGASARNRGIEAVEADFMAILDADDLYHPRRLAALAEAARRRPDLDIITTDARIVRDGRPQGRLSEAVPFAVEDQRAAIFASNFVGGWPAVRRERLQAVGGFDEGMRIAYDWDCWLRLILAGATAGMVDAPYYDYVLRSGSLSASRVPSLWERPRLLEKAQADPSLRDDERKRLRRAIHWRRSEAVREELRALLARDPSRRRLLRLSAVPDVDTRARALALLGAIAPAAARRSLGRSSTRA